MTLFQMLKRNAKLALKGAWGKAVAALVIWLLFQLVFTFLQQYATELLAPYTPYGSGSALDYLFFRTSPAETAILCVFLVLTLLLGAPLYFGFLGWFYSLTKGVQAPVTEIFALFESFRKYLKSIGLCVTVFVRTTLWAFLFLALPTAMVYVSNGILRYRFGILGGNPRVNSAVGGMGMALSIILLVLACVLYAVFITRYTLSLYLLFENPDQKVTQLIRDSVRYSRGYRLSLLGFSLSFIGWFALSCLIIPMFYVMPYYYTSIAMYSRYIIERRSREPVEATREFRSARAADAMEAARAEDAPTEPLPEAEGHQAEQPVAEGMGFPQNTAYSRPEPEELRPDPLFRTDPSPDEDPAVEDYPEEP